MNSNVFLLLFFVLISFPVMASEKPNCKLTIRTYFKDGNRSIKIEEVYKETRTLCKKEAKDRQKFKKDDEIEKIKVSYGYRDLATHSQ